MDVTARELRDTEIRETFRGYSREDVEELLGRAATTIESLTRRVRDLGERLTEVQAEPAPAREAGDIIQRTLVLAQRAADEEVASAQTEARRLRDEAEAEARRLREDAEADARRHRDSERRRLEEEIVELASRRDALRDDVEALGDFEREYRERLVRSVEADLAVLTGRSPARPGPEPTLSDVAVPAMAERDAAPSPRDEVAAPDRDDDRDDDHDHDHGEDGDADLPTAAYALVPDATRGGEARDAGGERVAVATGQGRAPAFPSRDPAEARNGTANGGRGGAGDATAGRAPGIAAAGSTAHASDASDASDADDAADDRSSLDLFGEEAVEAEVLDDDAFFASLREATSDERPASAEESSFFDQDDSESRGRDLFRRRRS